MSQPDNKFLQEHLEKLKECPVASDRDCDKGPLIQSAIDKIDRHVSDSQEFYKEFRETQKELTLAMKEIAVSQAHMINLNKQTQHHQEDINNLYNMHRSNQTKITDHLINDHSYKEEKNLAADHPDSAVIVKASRYDKLTLMLIAGVATWFGNLIFKAVKEILNLINGGP